MVKGKPIGPTFLTSNPGKIAGRLPWTQNEPGRSILASASCRLCENDLSICTSRSQNVVFSGLCDALVCRDSVSSHRSQAHSVANLRPTHFPKVLCLTAP